MTLAGLGALCLAGTAHGQNRSYAFTSEITDVVGNPYDLTVALGDRTTVWLAYDAGVTGSPVSSDLELYQQSVTGGISARVGGQVFTSNQFTFIVQNDRPSDSSDGFTITTNTGFNASNDLLQGSSPVAGVLQIFNVDVTGMLTSSTSLLELDPSLFGDVTFTLVADNDNWLRAVGTFTPKLGGDGAITNGSFESGPVVLESNTYVTLSGGSTELDGWVVTGTSIDYNGPSWLASDGFRALDLDGAGATGGIEQTFATGPGHTYDVYFDLSGNPEGNHLGSPQIKSVQVNVDGFSEIFTYDTLGQSRSSLIWEPNSFSFAATGTSATLSFTSLSPAGNSWGATIDNVRVIERFNDAPTEHWAFSFIQSLIANRITAGCGGGDYCPDHPVTRAQMAVFLERGMNGSDFSPPAASGNVFLDVGQSNFAASFIEQLFADGITSGCGANNYCPQGSVTRAQMAVFLLRALYGSAHVPPPPTGTAFTDVDVSHWAAPWIEQLASLGVTSGCGGNNYCPDAPVTRAQMAVFLVRIFGL